MNNSRHIVSVGLAAVGLLLAAEAGAQDPPYCKKIKTSAAQCDVTEELEDGSDCSLGGAPSSGDVVKYHKVLYTDVEGFTTPALGVWGRLVEACRKYADAQAHLQILTNARFSEYDPGEEVQVKVIIDTPTYKSGICLIDVDQDEVVEQDTTDDYTVDVWLDEVQPDPVCFRTPNGPYKDVPGGGNTYGNGFSDDINYRSLIEDTQSTQRLIPIRSPLYGLPVTDGDGWRKQSFLNVPNWNKPYGIDYFFSLAAGGQLDDSVEYAHIIPAIDTKGCKCGKNSNANLMLLSHKLNNEMSNDWQHPAAAAMITEYTLP